MYRKFNFLTDLYFLHSLCKSIFSQKLNYWSGIIFFKIPLHKFFASQFVKFLRERCLSIKFWSKNRNFKLSCSSFFKQLFYVNSYIFTKIQTKINNFAKNFLNNLPNFKKPFVIFVYNTSGVPPPYDMTCQHDIMLKNWCDKGSQNFLKIRYFFWCLLLFSKRFDKAHIFFKLFFLSFFPQN